MIHLPGRDAGPLPTLLELLMRLHRGDPAAGHDSTALQVSERGRARSLLDALTEVQIDLRSGVDAQLVAEERRLQRKLNDQSAAQIRLLSRNHTPEQAAAQDAKVKETIDLLEETRAKIKRSNPGYAALTQPQMGNVELIQRELLDDNTLLLEYALGEQRSYLFLVSPSSLETFTLPPGPEIESRARRVYELLGARPRFARRNSAAETGSRRRGGRRTAPRGRRIEPYDPGPGGGAVGREAPAHSYARRLAVNSLRRAP